jgi:molybdopterin molybdotransferase
MTSVEEALEIVRGAAEAAAAVAPLSRERVALSLSLRRTLAEDVAMDHDVPPFDRATMDGFAVRVADLAAGPAVLRVTARVFAGQDAVPAVRPGEAVAIMTGAPIPDGADAIVPIEATSPAAGPAGAETSVRVPGPLAPGSNVARRAEQAKRGDVVLRAGTRIHPGTVAVLAAAGRTAVPVLARPRVAVIATGDELVPAGDVPGPGRIRDGNGHAIAAQAERAGGVARYDGPVSDDPRALVAAVERGLEADVLCVSGGVSVGEKDHVPAVLERCGVTRLFHRWAVKPGGPLWFGRRGGTLVFGLPGNPAATFVGFEVLAVPALRARAGGAFVPRATRRAVFRGASGKAIPRRRYVPVTLEDAGDGRGLAANPVRWTGSGDPFGLAAAEALAVLPENVAFAASDARVVDVHVLEVAT